jgi:hypothetical protein
MEYTRAASATAAQAVVARFSTSSAAEQGETCHRGASPGPSVVLCGPPSIGCDRSMHELLDAPRIFVSISVVVLWLSAQLGAYASKKWRGPTGEERDDFNIVLSATLTLMGLIIGFTFSMAVSRYDQRKAYEESEANAIGTEYLRVELLPTDASRGAKALLRQYVDQRILFYQEQREDRLSQVDAQTAQLQNELWGVVLPVAAMQPTAAVALACRDERRVEFPGLHPGGMAESDPG